MSQLWLDQSGRPGRPGCRAGAAAAPGNDRQVALRHPPDGLGPGPAAGGQPATLTGLADLVTRRGRGRRSCASSSTRAGNKPCAQTQGLAARLKAIAEHHVEVAPEVLAQLQRMAQRVTPPLAGHDRQEPRHAAPVRRPRHAAAPDQPAGRAVRQAADSQGPPPKQLALRLQSALAVEILLVAPMRLKNLAGLELDRHLRRSGNGRQARWFVVIPGAEVKNGEPLELPLPERTVRLLETYRTRVLPVLAAPGALWLFPGEHGSKREVSLGPQISKFIRRELGCRLSPHQFRHLCGYLYLQRHPHGHEVVRAMLGHRLDRRPRSSSMPGWRGSPPPATTMRCCRNWSAPAPSRGAGDDGRLHYPPCPLPAARGLAGGRPAGLAAGDRQGDLLLDDGPGAALRPNTLRRHRASYGRWLAWLAATGPARPGPAGRERAPPLRRSPPMSPTSRQRNASGTVLVRLQSLRGGPALVGTRAGAAAG